MQSDFIKELDPLQARGFLDAMMELNPLFLAALVAEVAYGITTEDHPMEYLYIMAQRVVPVEDTLDKESDDSILDESLLN